MAFSARAVGRRALQRVDVEIVGDARQRRWHGGAADLQQEALARHGRRLVHPDEVGREAPGDHRPVSRIGEEIAADHVDLVLQGQGDRAAGLRGRQVAVEAHDPRHLGRATRTRHDDRIADGDASAGNGAGEAAEIRIGAVDPLHGETQRRLGGLDIGLDRLEMGEQRRSGVPRRVLAAPRDIVAEAGRHRDRHDRVEVERCCESGERGGDLAKAGFGEVDQVDLVDRQHDVADAEQVGDRGVAAGLLGQAVAHVDQQDGEIDVRGAGRHVAGELLVARRVGDDEGAPRAREEPVGDVDGDALLALGLEPVEQQGEVDAVVGRAEAARIVLQRLDLVLEQAGGVVDQPADQGRLAVVDRAAGEEAQLAAQAERQRIVCGRCQCVWHQK